jgi:uncharacterized membrane protein
MYMLECDWSGVGLFLLGMLCLSVIIIVPAYFVEKERKMKLDQQQREDQSPYRDKGDDWKGLYR